MKSKYTIINARVSAERTTRKTDTYTAQNRKRVVPPPANSFNLSGHQSQHKQDEWHGHTNDEQDQHAIGIVIVALKLGRLHQWHISHAGDGKVESGAPSTIVAN